MSGRRVGAPVLLLRYVVAMRGALALVSLVVVGLAFFGTLAPAAMASFLSDAQRHALDDMVPKSRDLTAEPQLTPPPELADDDWAGMRERLADARADMGPLMREMTDPGMFTVTSITRQAMPTDATVRAPTSFVITSLSPDLADHVRLVEGRLPAPPAGRRATADLVLSTASAAKMRWSVGEVRVLTGSSLRDRPYRLSGVYEARDPDGTFWRQTAASIQPVIFDDGNTYTVTATGWVSPDGLDALGVRQNGWDSRTRLWYPFHPDRATAAQAPELVDELSAFTRSPVPLVTDESLEDVPNAPPPVVAAFSTQTTGVLRETQVTSGSLVAVASVLAAGPAAAALCVLVLATGLVRARSAPLLTLTQARGASRPQTAYAAAVVGALVGIPSALVGAGAAAVWAPDDGGAVPWWPAVLCAALPAVTGVVTVLASGPRRTSRVPRLAVELVLAGLTAASLVAVAQQGLGARGSSLDPLLVAAPVLLCLLGAAVALRLLPSVAARAVAWQRRRTGLVGLLGAARTRDDATSPAAVVALVAAIGAALAASAAVATLEAGRTDTARTLVGVDLRVSGAALSPDAITQVEEMPGVDGVATITDGSRVPLSGDHYTIVTRVLADTAALTGLPNALADSVPALSALDAPRDDGRVPVVVSDAMAAQLDGEREIAVDGVDSYVVGVAPDRLVDVGDRTWVLADRDVLGDEAPAYDPPVVLLVDLDAPADDALVAAVQKWFPGADVTSPGSERDRLEADPVVGGVNALAWTTAVTSAVLVGATVVLALVGGAAARARDLAVVRALGLSARRGRRLPLWEVGLVVVTAAVIAVVVGAVIPYAVLGAVDLRAFTGGTGQPATTIPLLWWGGLVGCLAVVTAVGALVAATGAGRREVADALRMMEE